MGAIRLYGDTSGYLELAAPAVAPSSALTIPAGGFGKVLQVVQATSSTFVSTTSTSFVDVTGISVTITPTQATSRVLVMCYSAAALSSSNDYVIGQFRLADSSGTALTGAEAQYIGTSGLTGTGAREFFSQAFVMAYASPATTSAVTYKLQFRSPQSQVTTKFNNSGNTGQIFAIEVAA